MEERILEAERAARYRGIARVALEVLHFDDQGDSAPLTEGRKNIERLKGVFRIGGVRRLDPNNYVPAIVDEAVLEEAVRSARITEGTLLSNPDPPTLAFPEGYRLVCLHGRSRIAAARETLSARDAWWTVKLYTADSSPDLQLALEDQFANERRPPDGVIYRKIRQYGREHNLALKRKWEARLSEHGRRIVLQLNNHEMLTAAFDDLLEIPGLWDGMRLSTLHKAMATKCDEEMLHYLAHIKETWSRICNHDTIALRKMDQATVRALELKAPGYSRRDARALRAQSLDGQILRAFSHQEQKSIMHRLRLLDCQIPSLYTFSEDLKYLIACADCFKHVLTLSHMDTMSTALDRTYSQNSQKDVDSIKRELWLYTMRHYLEMPKLPTKEDDELLAKPAPMVDEPILRDFTLLFNRSSYATPEILDGIAVEALESPRLVCDDPKVAGKRCGFPSKKAYKTDKKFLFLSHLHKTSNERGEDVTSYFVRRAVYFAFFGPSESDPNVIDLHARSSSQQLSQETDTGMLDLQQASLDELEQERLEQERLEQERPERLEQERLEQERLEQERYTPEIPCEPVGLRARRHTQIDLGNLEDQPESTSSEGLAEQSSKRQTQIHMETLFSHLAQSGGVQHLQEQTASSDLQRLGHVMIQSSPPDLQDTVCVTFIIREQDVWRISDTLTVELSDPSEVQRVALKYTRKKYGLFSTDFGMLAPGDCFEAALADKWNVLLVLPDMDIDDKLAESLYEHLDSNNTAARKRNRQ